MEDEQSVGGGYFTLAVNIGNNGLLLIKGDLSYGCLKGKQSVVGGYSFVAV